MEEEKQYSGEDLVAVAKKDLVKEAKDIKGKQLNQRENLAMGKVARVLAKHTIKEVKKRRSHG